MSASSKEINRPVALVFDGSSSHAYISLVRDAVREADWLLDPYDREIYAVEDLEDHVANPNAVIAVLGNDYYTSNFEGSRLLQVAAQLALPRAIATDHQAHIESFDPLFAKDLLIDRGIGLVDKLSSWLINLTASQE